MAGMLWSGTPGNGDVQDSEAYSEVRDWFSTNGAQMLMS